MPQIDRTPSPVDNRPHVVIVGAGFGGLACAEALGGTNIRVTVIDRNNYHLFVPLLYQVATAALSPADIAEPIRRIVSRHPNIDVVMGEVTGIDRAAKRVELADGSFIPYDRLVLATGSSYSYFGHDDWAEIAPGLKTIENARRIRARLLMNFEQAEMCEDPARQRALMTTIVVGGGPTGVEMAGAVAELARFALARDFRRIDPRTARVLLVEAGPRILSTFPEDLGQYARRKLEELGVVVLTGQAVESITPEGATVGGRFIPAGAIVWGAGVKASPAGSWLGVETDRSGRIPVNADMSVPGVPDVYALGDTAALAGDDGKPLPGLAQVAKQQGEHLGGGLEASLLRGQPLEPFRFRNRGNTAIVGRSAAVFDFGTRKLKGWFAWVLWAIVHVYLLVNFQKRMLVTMQWLWRWMTYQRGARLITTDRPVSVAESVTSPHGREAKPFDPRPFPEMKRGQG